MVAFTVFSIAIISAYVILIYSWYRAWIKHEIFSSKSSKYGKTKISVVIAFRNEKDNLPGIVYHILNQNLPKHRYEVVFIDDHSDDGGEDYILKCCRQYKNIKYFRLEELETGKKAALDKGVRMAENELIVLTDADCIMPPDWLINMAGFYEYSGAGIITGLVDINVKLNFFGKFQEIEFLSLSASGSAAVATNKPVFCSAANMAFKREIYFDIEDPMSEKHISGDDTFLLHKVKKEGKYEIKLLKSADAIVKTKGEYTFKGFLRQRFRWASKSIYYRDRDTIYLSCLVFLTALLITVLFIFCLFGKNCILFFIVLSFKILADLLFLNSFLSFMGKKKGFYIAIFELPHAFYIVFTAITGILFKVGWKGRR